MNPQKLVVDRMEFPVYELSKLRLCGTEQAYIKWSTQGKRGRPCEFASNLVLISGKLILVNSFMHISPGVKNTFFFKVPYTYVCYTEAVIRIPLIKSSTASVSPLTTPMVIDARQRLNVSYSTLVGNAMQGSDNIERTVW